MDFFLLEKPFTKSQITVGTQNSSIKSTEGFRIDHQLLENEDAETAYQVIHWLYIVHIPLILFLNAAVMIIIRKVRLFHTPDNYILFSMAACDGLCGFAAIMELIEVDEGAVEVLRGTRPMCVLRLGFTLFCYNCSLSLLALMTLERYTAITAPYWHHDRITEHSVTVCIACVIAGEIFYNVVLLAIFLKYNTEEPRLLLRCHATINTPRWYGHYMYEVKFAVEVALVMFFSVSVYLLALQKLDHEIRPSIRPELRPDEISSEEKALKKSEIMMLLTISWIEPLLWIPILFTPVVRDNQSHDFGEIYRSLSRHLLFIIAYKNPAVYGLRKPLFRRAYKFLMSHKPTRWKDLNSFMNEESSVFLNSHYMMRLRLMKSWRQQTDVIKKVFDEHRTQGPYYGQDHSNVEEQQNKKIPKLDDVSEIKHKAESVSFPGLSRIVKFDNSSEIEQSSGSTSLQQNSTLSSFFGIRNKTTSL